MGTMTPREERLARLRHERYVAIEWLRRLLLERNFSGWFRNQAWTTIAQVRILDAKIAHLTALTPFERETVVRACQHIHQGSTSALYAALRDVEARMKS